MEALFPQLLTLLYALWWPFVRILAAFSASPIVGDAGVPISVRVLLSLVLAVVMLPLSQSSAAIDPWSLHGIVVTAEQAVIGLLLGLAFHLTMMAINLLGYLISSQMGLAMAVMNDPSSGASSDIISVFLYVLSVLIFFAVDGHLVFTQVIASSFRIWPPGGGLSFASLEVLAVNVSWIFSAAFLMAIPIIFSTLVVQIGFGFLNRIAPTLNLFSLGFSVFTIFGLFMLTQMLRAFPEHYLSMTNQVLDMFHHGLRTVPHE